MWMNHTIARADPGNVDEAVELLDTPEVLGAFRKASGFRGLYFVANLQEPSEVISITVWDSAAEGQAFYASDQYKHIFGSVVHLVTAPPQHKFFEVLIEHVMENETA